MENLGHNPDATQDEILKHRASFNLRDHLAQAAGAPRVQQPSSSGSSRSSVRMNNGEVSMDEVITNLRLGGFEIIPAGEKARIDELAAENKSLRDRTLAAEAAAADAIRELKSLKEE